MRSNNAGVFWGILLVGAVLHFTFCEWTDDYQRHDPQRIVGINRVVGVRTKSPMRWNQSVLLGICAPAALLIAAGVLKPE